MTHRTTLTLALLGLAVSLLALTPSDVRAKGKRAKARVSAQTVWAGTPLGRQGLAGSNANVVVPFGLLGTRPGRIDVEAQYGIDRDGDGAIADDEYRPATEDRLDSRNTRANHAPRLYRTGASAAAANAFVWNSLADVGFDRVSILEYALTPQGRFMPDPDNEGSFLFATVAGGELPPGVKIRLRSVKSQGRRKPLLTGDWVETGSFSIDNTSPPSMTIDSVADGDTVLVDWTAFDPNSEDLNGNGVLDFVDGEDVNANGELDIERVGVAFDFHALTAGEDPANIAKMTDAQLAALAWRPCDRAAGVGDTDSLDARVGVPLPASGDLAGVETAPPGVGRSWVFAWDATRQVGSTPKGCILRATPFDQTRTRGTTVYFRGFVHAGK